MISTFSLVMSVALAAAAPPKALVVSYQASGVEEPDVERLAKALRNAVETHGWTTVEEISAQRQAKSASMCGEDAACLATVGQRTESQWVLGFSVGKTSKGFIFSTVFVEVASAQRKSGSIEKLSDLPEDLTNLGRTLVDPLFRDVPQAVVLTPATTGEAPAVTTARGRPLRGAGAGLLAAGGAVGIAGMVLGIVAGTNFENLNKNPDQRTAAAYETQRSLNGSADIAVGVGIAALATGIVLLIADAASAPSPPAEAEGGAQ